MPNPLVDYFGCPPEFLLVKPGDDLSKDAAFFRFGPDTICYGRSWRGSRFPDTGASLYDALPDVVSNSSGLQLSFDLAEVLCNLRYERYAARIDGAGNLLRAGYYTLRPLFTVALRKPLQRFWLRGWDRIDFPRWPVDTTVEHLVGKILALCMKAQGITKVPFIWFWPNGANAAFMLTHDIETAAGRDFCSELMDLDGSFGMRSSFQVIPEERYHISEAFLSSIRDRGFEINIHDLNHDGKLFRGRSTFLKRAERINRYAKDFGALGFRSGVLYRNLNWYDAFTFVYDMSVPNVGHLDPQRGGCCTVMPFWVGDVLELPLTTTQDYTLFIILGQYSLDLWKEQIAQIVQAHGLISFNIHPDYIIPSRARRCYTSLLEYICQNRDKMRLWIARPREVAEWWKQRAQMHIVNDGEWRIQGTGSQYASVAWAVLEGDHVSFVFETKTTLSRS